MDRYRFKQHSIRRTCKKDFDSYRDYRPYLYEDFSEHCCYCNMSQRILSDSFHVEHFIPRAKFEGKKDYLLTKYENLMLACPKCNSSKGNAYEGDLEQDDSITNKLFYNPVETDYNDIFYRDKTGRIKSDDAKGKAMIDRLSLFRPVHNMAWLVEEYAQLIIETKNKAESEKNPEKAKRLNDLAAQIALEHFYLNMDFVAIYTGRKILYCEEKDLE